MKSITLKVLSSKFKENTDWKFVPVCFFSASKIVIGPVDNLGKSFQEVFNRTDNWISEGFGWIIESIDTEYVNISNFNPLPGSSYIELHEKLRNSKKCLINIKNSDNESFLWCHLKHLKIERRLLIMIFRY